MPHRFADFEGFRSLPYYQQWDALVACIAHTGNRYEFTYCYHRIVELQKQGKIDIQGNKADDLGGISNTAPDDEA